MNCLWRRHTIPAVLNRLIKQEIKIKPLYCDTNTTQIHTSFKPIALRPVNLSYCVIRYKSKKQRDLDSDDEEEVYDNDDASLSRDSKVIKINTTSLRTDGVLKSALGVSRNKIEQMFYESKIRINGKKLLKKSTPVKIGSEIDVIKSISTNNPNHLYVSRIEVLNITAKEESIAVTVRRFKNLLIENYDKDPYKAATNTEDE